MIGVFLGGLGCSSYSGYCADAMDCAGGNDNDIDACEVVLEHEEDVASINGCDEEWDDYFVCLEDKSDCDGDQYGPEGSCNDEAEDLDRCIH
jgi:hypothetical protein